MISGILFLNQKGDVIISRYYRDDLSKAAVDAFRVAVIASRQIGTPIVSIDHTSFLYARAGDVYIVACTRHNANPALIFQYIYMFIDVLHSYLGVNVEEASIQNNFVIIYELLDECMDYGWPQITSTPILQSFIQSGDAKNIKTGSAMFSEQDTRITSQITGSVDWRQPGKYNYRNNELFLDIVEAVNLIVGTQGQVLRADVSGKVLMKACLNGMPECRLGLNDRLNMDKDPLKQKSLISLANSSANGIVIDDVQFHRCVKLGAFDSEHTISFIPPDGEFELMTYRVTNQINLPFRVLPVVTEHGRTRVEYEVKITGNFSARLFANSVTIVIPTPNNVARVSMQPQIGKAKYHALQHCIFWKIKKFSGDASFMLKAEAVLLPGIDDKMWSKPPITLDFDVPMFTASGLHVRFLKVFERSNYETIKWIRYVLKAGSYQIRL